MKPPFAGVLLITVWSQGGKPVARLRGYEDVHQRPCEDVYTGTEKIMARVAEWLAPFDVGEIPKSRDRAEEGG